MTLALAVYVQDWMPIAMVSTAASTGDTPSAMTCFSTATSQHLLIANLVNAGVIIGGGLAFFGFGALAVPGITQKSQESLDSSSHPKTDEQYVGRKTALS